jgi:hypothetical protein
LPFREFRRELRYWERRLRFALRSVYNGARGEEVVPTCADRVGSPDPNEKTKGEGFSVEPS